MEHLSYPDVVQWAVPFFIAAILAEFLWIAWSGRGGRYETRDAVTSLVMGAGNVASGILLGFIAWGFFMWLWELTPLDLGASLWVVALCFVLDDLRYYWVHRFGHRIRWVWASHVNHHSSQHYNLTTALQADLDRHLHLHDGDPRPADPGWASTRPWCCLCGGLNLIYQFWIHTEAIGKMPRWFEAVMNTPSHHRVHHGRNAALPGLPTMPACLIIWDKMFGTFVPELDSGRKGRLRPRPQYRHLQPAARRLSRMAVGICARHRHSAGLTLRQRLMLRRWPPRVGATMAAGTGVRGAQGRASETPPGKSLGHAGL